MKTVLAVLVAVSLAGSAVAVTVHRSFRNGYPAEAGGQSPGTQQTVKGASRGVQVLQAMLPPEKINEAAAFFAPVARKYKTTAEKFAREYQSSDEKMKVISKYLPDADKALSEARNMKVPARYEKEKDGYISFFEALLGTARVMTKFSSK